MTENNSWAEQWVKAQQQFVDAWGEMAKSTAAGSTTSQTDLWSQGFEMWRQACESQTQPDIRQAMQKCFDMGKEYFTMAEQISKSMSEGANPVDAINQWMEQLKKTLEQYSGLPGFNGANVNEFVQQWFNPAQSWQQMSAAILPMNQAAWQFPGMNTPVFNIGETIDPLGKILESPGIGYFREPQEKQQRGIQLGLEYFEANHRFNQAFLRVAIESIQGFQARLLKLEQGETPASLRGLYDLWVEVSEAHYAEFAMGEEYQALYGDMVNRLMILRKHYNEIADDMLAALNLPNTREVDTMQQRLQQLRRENFTLKKELAEIRSMLEGLGQKSTASKTPPRKKAAAARKAPARKKAAAPGKAAASKPATRRKTAARKKAAVKKSKVRG